MSKIFFNEFCTSLALALLGSQNIQLQVSILRTSQPPGSFWDSEREFAHASSDVPKPRFESLGLTSPWRHLMLDQPRDCRKLWNYHRLSNILKVLALWNLFGGYLSEKWGHRDRVERAVATPSSCSAVLTLLSRKSRTVPSAALSYKNGKQSSYPRHRYLIWSSMYNLRHPYGLREWSLSTENRVDNVTVKSSSVDDAITCKRLVVVIAVGRG